MREVVKNTFQTPRRVFHIGDPKSVRPEARGLNTPMYQVTSLAGDANLPLLVFPG